MDKPSNRDVLCMRLDNHDSERIHAPEFVAEQIEEDWS